MLHSMLPPTDPHVEDALPPVLAKAVEDGSWDYRVGLFDGTVFSCSGVEIVSSGWVGLVDAYLVGLDESEFLWGRTLNVRRGRHRVARGQ